MSVVNSHSPIHYREISDVFASDVGGRTFTLPSSESMQNASLEALRNTGEVGEEEPGDPNNVQKRNGQKLQDSLDLVRDYSCLRLACQHVFYNASDCKQLAGHASSFLADLTGKTVVLRTALTTGSQNELEPNSKTGHEGFDQLYEAVVPLLVSLKDIHESAITVIFHDFRENLPTTLNDPYLGALANNIQSFVQSILQEIRINEGVQTYARMNHMYPGAFNFIRKQQYLDGSVIDEDQLTFVINGDDCGLVHLMQDSLKSIRTEYLDLSEKVITFYQQIEAISVFEDKAINVDFQVAFNQFEKPTSTKVAKLFAEIDRIRVVALSGSRMIAHALTLIKENKGDPIQEYNVFIKNENKCMKTDSIPTEDLTSGLEIGKQGSIMILQAKIESIIEKLFQEYLQRMKLARQVKEINELIDKVGYKKAGPHIQPRYDDILNPLVCTIKRLMSHLMIEARAVAFALKLGESNEDDVAVKWKDFIEKNQFLSAKAVPDSALIVGLNENKCGLLPIITQVLDSIRTKFFSLNQEQRNVSRVSKTLLKKIKDRQKLDQEDVRDNNSIKDPALRELISDFIRIHNERVQIAQISNVLMRSMIKRVKIDPFDPFDSIDFSSIRIKRLLEKIVTKQNEEVATTLKAKTVNSDIAAGKIVVLESVDEITNPHIKELFKNSVTLNNDKLKLEKEKQEQAEEIRRLREQIQAMNSSRRSSTSSDVELATIL